MVAERAQKWSLEVERAEAEEKFKKAKSAMHAAQDKASLQKVELEKRLNEVRDRVKDEVARRLLARREAPQSSTASPPTPSILSAPKTSPAPPPVPITPSTTPPTASPIKRNLFPEASPLPPAKRVINEKLSTQDQVTEEVNKFIANFLKAQAALQAGFKLC